MSAEYYLSQLRVYSRFVRNFNPAQQKTRSDAEDRRRPGRRRAAVRRVDRDDHEVVEGAPVELGPHGRSLAAQLHRGALSRPPTSRSASARRSYAEILQATLEMDGLVTAALRDHGQVRPGEEGRAGRRRVGRLVRAAPGHDARLPRAAEQRPRRDHRRAQHQHLRASRRPRPHGQHRPDGQRPPGDDPDRRTEDGADADLPRRSGCTCRSRTRPSCRSTFDAGRYTHGSITLPRASTRLPRRTRPARCGSRSPTSIRTTPAEIATTLTGITPRSASGETLTGPAIDSVNTFEAPDTVVPKPAAGDARWQPAVADTGRRSPSPSSECGHEAGLEACRSAPARPARDGPARRSGADTGAAGHCGCAGRHGSARAGRRRQAGRRRAHQGARRLRSRATSKAMPSSATCSSSCRPSYAKEKSRRYPVVYALHGYSIGAEQWSKRDPRAADHRRRVRPGRARDDRRAAGLEDPAQRLDVFELTDRRRFRAVRRARPGRLRRRALPHAAGPRRAADWSATRWAATARRASA